MSRFPLGADEYRESNVKITEPRTLGCPAATAGSVHKTVYARGSLFCEPSNSVAPLHGSGGHSEGTPKKHESHARHTVSTQYIQN